jgi:hypothetical protein
MKAGINMKKYIKIIKYSKTTFPFQKVIFNHFRKKNSGINKNLNNIHRKIIFKNNVLHNVSPIKVPIHKLKKHFFNVKKDQKNKYVTYFYKIDPVFCSVSNFKKKGKFYKLYLKLLKHLKIHYFKESIIAQTRPTLRAHIPNNVSVGSYHRDSDYGHPEEEVNLWLPFNDAVNTSTLWLESSPDKGDFKPYNVKYGEILIFDSRLRHGTEVNIESNSRLSMDFRIIKNHNYKNVKTESPLNGIRFNLGNYFMNL